LKDLLWLRLSFTFDNQHEHLRNINSMKLPRVSVIIPNYNYAHYLPLAIDSVLAQTYPDVEIVVVDDGSTDNSESVLRNYGSRIRWLRQQNQGVAAARNHGVRETSGELVAFLDADDLWSPLKLELQVQRFLDEPELGLVHCGVEEIDYTGAHLRVRVDGLEGWVATQLLLFKRAVILGGGSGLMVPRAGFEAMKGFDTGLSTSADWDFFYRVAINQPVGFVPQPLVKYRIHTANMHANVRAMEHDMLIGYEKAFSSRNAELHRLRRQCYGNLHLVLAGSYFRAGQSYDFARHALKSLWLTPRNVTRLLGFPLRHLQRRRLNVPSSEASLSNVSDQAV
jgi:glycosyltransferase involved in cell wall biosynthesis